MRLRTLFSLIVLLIVSLVPIVTARSADAAKGISAPRRAIRAAKDMRKRMGTEPFHRLRG